MSFTPIPCDDGDLEAVNTTDSGTIEFSGNGMSGSPLTAEVVDGSVGIVTADTGSIDFSGDGTTASPLSANGTIASNRQTDSYTLVLADADTVVEMDKATANDLTLPPDTYDVNDCGEVMQYGAGQTSVVAGAGVTIRSPGGKLKIGAQYGACSWRLIASNEYHLEGNLTT